MAPQLFFRILVFVCLVKKYEDLITELTVLYLDYE